MEKKTVKILNKNLIEGAELLISNTRIIFAYKNFNIIKEGDMLFFILKEIRRELEKDDIFILINGCRKDVWPSGMSSVGTRAYKTTMNKSTTLNDLVDIFDDIDDFSLISTVDDQKGYHINWINSLGLEQ